MPLCAMGDLVARALPPQGESVVVAYCAASYSCTIIGAAHRLRNDLNCVEWDVKPCSTNQPSSLPRDSVWRGANARILAKCDTVNLIIDTSPLCVHFVSVFAKQTDDFSLRSILTGFAAMQLLTSD